MEISDRHVEWAVVNRLKAMLETSPKTEFNVTQSFAIFSTVVLWTKQRAWAEDLQRIKFGGHWDLRFSMTRGGFRRFVRSQSEGSKIPWTSLAVGSTPTSRT